MQDITKQLSEQTKYNVEYITNVNINQESHLVSFMVNSSFWMTAKLSKDNKRVLKNSVRKDIY